MATVNTQLRNMQATLITWLLDSLDIYTTGQGSLLAELTTLDWGYAASGAVGLDSTESDSSANNTGTAAEAELLHTDGAGTGYLVNGAVSADEYEVVIDTGSGELAKGDIIRFSGHAQDYAILKSQTGAGTIGIFPPLLAAVADNETITRQTAAEITGLTVGTSGSDINLNSVSIDSGEQVDITALTITAPAS